MATTTEQFEIAHWEKKFSRINTLRINWEKSKLLKVLHRQRLMSDAEVRNGQVENRPCNNGFSLIHKLACGHFVYTEAPTQCAKNCAADKALPINTAFNCILCFRRTYNWDAGRHNERWYDLFMPHFIDSKKKNEDKAQYGAVFRTAEPCYVHGSRFVLDPSDAPSVGLIRVLESQREAETEQLIETTCKFFGHDDESVTAALDAFNHLLCHHHVLNLMEIKVVATQAIKLCRDANRLPMNGPDLVRYMGIPWNDNCDGLMEANEVLKHIAADIVVLKFLKKAPRSICSQPNMKKIRPTAIRIWTRLYPTPTFSRRDIRVQQKVIMTAILHIAVMQLRLKMSFDRICLISDVEQDDLVPDIYDRVERFTRGKDWTKPMGGRKDKRKRVLEKHERAERCVGDVANCLNGWEM